MTERQVADVLYLVIVYGFPAAIVLWLAVNYYMYRRS